MGFGSRTVGRSWYWSRSLMMRGFRFFHLLVMLAACAAVSGCSAAACDTSDDGNPPQLYEGGNVYNAVNGSIYESSSAHGPLLHFPGGKRYDLVHHLGFEPLVVLMYWSFFQTGIAVDAQNDDAGTLTLASGNSALSQLANAHSIRVKNDSCVEFYLRVVAFGDSRGRPVNEGGTGSDEGGADDAGLDATPFTDDAVRAIIGQR